MILKRTALLSEAILLGTKQMLKLMDTQVIAILRSKLFLDLWPTCSVDSVRTLHYSLSFSSTEVAFFRHVSTKEVRYRSVSHSDIAYVTIK